VAVEPEAFLTSELDGGAGSTLQLQNYYKLNLQFDVSTS